MLLYKCLVDALDVDVDADVLAVQGYAGVVAARGEDTDLTQDVGDQPLAEQAAELHSVVERHAAQTEEALALRELVELQQEAALVLLLPGGGAVALVAQADALQHDVVPAERRGYVDAFGQRVEQALQVFVRDFELDALDDVGREELRLALGAILSQALSCERQDQQGCGMCMNHTTRSRP